MATFSLPKIYHVEKWNNPLHLIPFSAVHFIHTLELLRAGSFITPALGPLVIKHNRAGLCQFVSQTLKAAEEPVEEKLKRNSVCTLGLCVVRAASEAKVGLESFHFVTGARAQLHDLFINTRKMKYEV